MCILYFSLGPFFPNNIRQRNIFTQHFFVQHHQFLFAIFTHTAKTCLNQWWCLIFALQPNCKNFFLGIVMHNFAFPNCCRGGQITFKIPHRNTRYYITRHGPPPCMIAPKPIKHMTIQYYVKPCNKSGQAHTIPLFIIQYQIAPHPVILRRHPRARLSFLRLCHLRAP